MSNSNIVSVAEMIDAAFGEEDANVVNFKLIQAVLYLLARQLRILERRVKVEIEIDRGPSGASLSVTEVKIRATVPKKRKRTVKSGGTISEDTKIGKHGFTASKTRSITEYKSTSGKSIEKSSLDKSSTTKSSTDKTTSDETKSSTDKRTSDKTSSDKTSSDKTKSSTDKTSSDKSSTDKTSSEKTKSSSDKTSTEKSSTDKTSSEKTKSSTDKTSTQQSSTDKTSTDKSSTDKTSTEQSSTDKTSTEKSATDKTSTEKSSTDKTSTEKSSTDKTSTEKSSTDKTSTEKSSTDKTSSEKTKSSTDKTSTDKTTSSSKKSSSTKDTSSSGGQYKGKDLPNLLEFIEEQREKELRVIHQRADSREVGEKSPTPMASLDSVEEQYEKLLVVERVPAESKRSSIGGKRTPQLSIVTQEQFEALANVVRELQSRFTPIATPGFPDNTQLMHELRKGASLTDAMAALQLSARLEAAEKTLQQMLALVTDLVSTSGLEIDLKPQGMPDDTKVLHEATETSTPKSKKSTASKQSKVTSKSNVIPSPADLQVSMPSSEPSKIDIMPTPTSIPGPEEEKLVVPVNWITFEELDNAIEEVSNGLLKTLTLITTQCNANAADAIKIAKRLEEKLDSSLNLGSRMSDLELLVSKFSEEITIVDTALSAQMTNYQELLTQMQHDLEAGLEGMTEALANIGGDTAAVAELNANFTNLQTDVDIANTRQKELTESQNALSDDLRDIWQQIEMLRELKSDRDEVADALRDKAGLADLNGLVSLQQFNAVRGDFEKRIGAAYDKFNNQEITWQKAIDDLLRELNEKADWDQLVALRDDINNNLVRLRNRINAMLEVVGEPRAAAVSRKLFRDDACLSCSTPAHMDLEEPSAIPKMPAFPGPSTRPPTIGAEDTSKPAEDGDHGVCFPGQPIPHPRDPRSHICHRYCGGSHTLVPDKKSRTPIGLTIIPVSRRVTTGIGSDGKTYKIEETMPARKPCLPCNEKKLNTPQPSEADPVKEKEEYDSDMTPSDFLSTLRSVDEQKDDSATPPPPTEEF